MSLLQACGLGGVLEGLFAHHSVCVEAISLLQAFGFVSLDNDVFATAASGAARVVRRGNGWLLVILV